MYDNSLKKKLFEEVCIHGKSTMNTAKAYGVPLKTFKKWITSNNKDNRCFNHDNLNNNFSIIDPIKNDSYDDLSFDELKRQLMKKDIEIARLKKGYMVKGGGMEKNEFVTFYKKNTK